MGRKEFANKETKKTIPDRSKGELAQASAPSLLQSSDGKAISFPCCSAIKQASRSLGCTTHNVWFLARTHSPLLSECGPAWTHIGCVAACPAWLCCISSFNTLSPTHVGCNWACGQHLKRVLVELYLWLKKIQMEEAGQEVAREQTWVVDGEQIKFKIGVQVT